ncbi:MAG: hypothetical protein MRY32_09055 [Rickettsiales bacterium]|nr:hypothetical protein [Rickettsiales bacterium]
MRFQQHLFNLDEQNGTIQSHYQTFTKQIPEIREYLAEEKQLKPFLQLPDTRDDLDAIRSVADYIKRSAKRLVVLGTGGSSLGGQTLCALKSGMVEIDFWDNVDPHTIELKLNSYDLAQTHFLMISKSGGTVETLVQTLLVLQHLEEALGREKISHQCHVITTPQESPLWQLAQQYSIPLLDHDPNLGGRFTVLSCVGLIPAMVAGVDVAGLRDGAQQVLDASINHNDAAAMLGAAWQCALMEAYPQTVIMPYCDRLGSFGAWVQQLWAESLGKAGKGSTPLRAIGAVDQHSQLQLYLDGPRDKGFHLITLPHQGQGPTIDTKGIEALEYLNKKEIGTVMAALQYGTLQTLKQHKLPLRQWELETLDEPTMGAMLMHMMIETVAAAKLLNVDPYDQPAVEEGKALARGYLRDGSL